MALPDLREAALDLVADLSRPKRESHKSENIPKSVLIYKTRGSWVRNEDIERQGCNN
jgi:hypothetical protein